MRRWLRALVALLLAVSLAPPAAAQQDAVARGLAARAATTAAIYANPPYITAALGDSITAFGTINTGSLYGYSIQGTATWLQMLSGGRILYPATNNFGVGGDTLQMIAVRVPNVIASGASMVIVEGGTNNLTTITDEQATYAAMVSTMRDQIIAPLLRAGITVVVLPIRARNIGSSSQLRVRERYNRWLIRLGQGASEATGGWSVPGLPVVINTDQYALNRASTTSAPLADRISLDILHPSPRGGYWAGRAVWDVLKTRIAASAALAGSGYTDSYDATFNPAGSLITFGGTSGGYGHFYGTGGTLVSATGLTPTGAIATGWNAKRASGSSAATFVLSKENPRTDGPASGERQAFAINVTGAGAANEFYEIYAPNTGAISVGDKLYAECRAQLSAVPTNFSGFDLVVQGSAQEAHAANYNVTYVASDGSSAWPAVQIPEQLYLRTPDFVTTSTTLTVRVQIYVKADTGSASVAGWVSDCALRKVLS